MGLLAGSGVVWRLGRVVASKGTREVSASPGEKAGGPEKMGGIKRRGPM